MEGKKAVVVDHEVPPERLLADLERYWQEAIRLGMPDAKVIATDQVVVDERVRGKCRIPLSLPASPSSLFVNGFVPPGSEIPLLLCWDFGEGRTKPLTKEGESEIKTHNPPLPMATVERCPCCSRPLSPLTHLNRCFHLRPQDVLPARKSFGGLNGGRIFYHIAQVRSLYFVPREILRLKEERII